MNPTTEDLLRDTLATEAGTATPADALWEAVRAGAAARRSRRRRVRALAAGGAAAATIAVVLLVAGLRGDGEPKGVETVGEEDGTTPATVAAGPPPNQMVAVVDGRLVVLDAADGSVERVLPVDKSDSVRSGLAVSPDGRFVAYVAWGDCQGDAMSSLRGVDTRIGTESSLGLGHSPVFSPDGQHFAYGSCYTDQRRGNMSLTRRGALGVVEGGALADDELEPATGPPGEAFWVEPMAFLPSGRLLVLVGENRDAAYTLDPDRFADAPPGEAPVYEPFPLPPGTTAIALLDGDELAVARSLTGGSDVVAVDADTGEQRGVLFELPEWGIATMRADATGRHLAITAVNALSSLDVPPTLWRWSRGDPEPTRAGTVEGLVDAVWLPPPGSVPAATTTPTAPPPADSDSDGTDGPEEIAAVTSDGRLVVLDGVTGAELRQLNVTGTAMPDSVSLSADGHTVYWTSDLPADAECPSGDSHGGMMSSSPVSGRTDTGGDYHEYGQGRWPAISPDGRFLAYLVEKECGGPRSLVFHDLRTYMERSWDAPPAEGGGPPLELTGPLSWDAEGRYLVVPVEGDPDTKYLLAYTGSVQPTIEGVRIGPIDEDGPVGLRYVGNTGDLAAVRQAGDGSAEVGGVDPETGDWNGVTYFRIEDPGGRIVAFDADASGEHLLVLTADGDLLRVDPQRNGTEPGFAASGIVAAEW